MRTPPPTARIAQLDPAAVDRLGLPAQPPEASAGDAITGVQRHQAAWQRRGLEFDALADLQRRGLGTAVQGFGLGISHFPRLTQLNPGWVLLAEAVARRNTDPGDLRALRALIRMARCLDARIAWPTGVSLPPIQHSRLDVDAVVIDQTWMPGHAV